MNPRDIDVIAPNFKRRLSGVTSTIIQLVPLQAKSLGIAVLGPGLPADLPRLRFRQLPRLWTRPNGRPFRLFHARRNVEMLFGVVLRDALRMPLRLVFTSASQRRHTGWTRFLIRRMDAVIATSGKTAAYLQGPATTIRHGIDTDRFSPPADPAAAKAALGLDPAMRYVGCFGRVRHQKGTDLFVDAMIRLLPAHPGWSALVAGRATAEHLGFEADLKARVARAGLSDRILFVGEHRDIDRWYKALSLFVAPQRWEGFGLTPLEAMASGVPVIARDVGAFSELVPDGVTGRIVAPGDPDAMTDAIGGVLANERFLADAGAAALVHVRAAFPLSREVEELRAVYERVWREA
ncbi:glycosyl transferase family 1 [Aureimonas sp. Leaf454]|uniref:glycosyltransferase family 4 protein n=1 Tax=Aureimonas sp. Leaf454 TaxID=1736381 RepID=UPI0006F9627B|nr:glycosyltransferase family 4 protein [Aureimonas sp. Leaf454]KQT45077.1 glycosyl transferase family 1 [Aureimonas sp. Leaf454]